MRRFSIFGKAFLYAVPLFLAPCIEKLADILMNDLWPSPQRVAFSAMLGLSSMCFGLRAYFDGSYERDRLKPEDGKDLQTVNETKTP